MVKSVREARSDVKAPLELREKIAALLGATVPVTRKADFPTNRPKSRLRGRIAARWLTFRFAMASVALMVLGSFWFLSQREARAAQFVQMATHLHQSQLQNSVPIQLRTSSVREVMTWFAPKLSFRLRLPTYQDQSGNRSRYQMLGASLTLFRGRPAAYVAYRMKDEKISLIVISSDQAVASGGETTTAKSITFHSIQKGDLETITWSVHHLTYALVSSAKTPPRQSCAVCHANPEDHALQQSAVTRRPRFLNRAR